MRIKRQQPAVSGSRGRSWIRGVKWKGLSARIILRAGAAMLCLVLAGCQGLPRLSKAPPSKAVAPLANPTFANTGSGQGGRSGRLSEVSGIENGRESFATRVALARFARQSLDMQYYIWDGDQTGTYLLSELLDAADRGVRVRLLLDDHSSHGIVVGILLQLAAGVRAVAAELEDGLALVTPQALHRRNQMRHMMEEIHTGGRDLVAAALDTHPNIEVRMFNPFPSRDLGGIERMFQLVGNFSLLNRRMHNKVFAADNQLAVVGGRNIADNYFGMHTEQIFRDLDLLVRGPVVREVSSNFDLYWNSQWAVPVQAFAWRARSERRLVALRKELDLVFDEKKDPSLRQLDQDEAATAVLRDVTSRMIEAPVTVVADVPEKFSGAGKPLVAEALDRLADQSRKEILIENAYFVPANRSFAKMEQRLGDGVAIRALTNSLATNDVLPAHAGYAKYRKRLLRSGVQMHELRPYSRDAASSGLARHGPRWALHTKAVVFDRQRVFVGTFNLDPRSADLNTENGLLVESPVLAAEIARFIEQGMQPDWSWRVDLGRPGEPTNGRGKGRLFWSTGDPAKPETTSREPEANFGSRLLMRLVSWLPVDNLL